MRQVWTFPKDDDLKNSGPNWFFNLLAGVNADTRTKLIFLLWRTWHHRNNVIHGDGKASIAAFVPFLQNYVASFLF